MRAVTVGEHAVLLEVESAEAVLNLHAHVRGLREAGALGRVVDIVPGERTLLLDGLDRPSLVADQARSWVIPATSRPPAGEVDIDVVYDGDDLEAVAGFWGCTPGEVGAIHAGFVYSVAFCGFAPGFAYMTGLPEHLAVPRRATPRAAVPPGSVAVAGCYTGIYPRSSPGGWQLIGRTGATLWDVKRRPAAMLTPGTRVRIHSRS